ncbi:MAG: response regulator transcription factor [Stackebrandtia sp.]
MNLTSLGVTPPQERIYRHFLRNPGTAAVASELELTKAELDASIERLLALQLLRREADATLHPADPQTVVDRLIGQRLDEIKNEMTSVTSARAALPSLLTEYTSRRAVELIERVEGADAAHERLMELTYQADEVLAMSPVPSPVRPGRLERVVKAVRLGIACRTIVHRDVVAEPDYLAARLQLHRAGDRHRVTDTRFRAMVMLDRGTAFVPIDPDDPHAGALLIRQPGVVATLVDQFEQIWEHAAELDPESDDLTESERRVLELLTTYAKDETAAREMEISVRTYRRHVANLMARLGAGNRFHLGQLATKRGWV